MMCERSCVVRLIASTVGKVEVVFIKVGGIMDLGNKSRNKVSASVVPAFKDDCIYKEPLRMIGNPGRGVALHSIRLTRRRDEKLEVRGYMPSIWPD